MTAVTTNKRPQRFFSSGSNLRFGGRQSTVTMGFHALAQSRLSPRFSSTRKNKSFLQYFATGSVTASCQDYEESNLLSVCRRKHKLSTYLQTVIYNHINFLNARSQLVWILLAQDSIQARSQVFNFLIYFFFLWGAAMQKGDGPNETRRGKSLGGEGKLWLSETEEQGKFTIGGRGGIWLGMRWRVPPRAIRGHAPPEHF